MFNVLKDQESKNPVQKHILKGFIRPSQCLLNVIPAARAHWHWHRKDANATFPLPRAVQT